MRTPGTVTISEERYAELVYFEREVQGAYRRATEAERERDDLLRILRLAVRARWMEFVEDDAASGLPNLTYQARVKLETPWLSMRETRHRSPGNSEEARFRSVARQALVRALAEGIAKAIIEDNAGGHKVIQRKG